MSAKHFFNDPDQLVQQALQSIPLSNPSVGLDLANKIIYRKVSRAGSQACVSLISGGGSGHEPSFAAFVGNGLLTAAVAGTIFASPSATQVRKAVLERVDGRKGVLVIVMNYTGDVLNFGMAVEQARASGLEVEMLVVGDDVGVGRHQGGKVGRRGIAGTVLVHKIAGAIAAQGASLQDVHRVAKLAASNIVSVGASLDHVHVPGRAPPDPSSAENVQAGEVEIGMGIHNEQGSARVQVKLSELVQRMLSQLLDMTEEDRAFLQMTTLDSVVVMINNLGGVSPLELGGITTEVIRQLKATYDVQPVRIYSGTFMTSLNGMGFSITLLKLVDTDLGGNASMESLLDAQSEGTGWAAPITSGTWTSPPQAEPPSAAQSNEDDIPPSTLKMDPTQAGKALTTGLKQLIAAEADITRYDTVVGDGDCGIGLKRGAEAILEHLSKNGASGDVVVEVSRLARVLEGSMDGTSGALYTIFVNSLAHALRSLPSSGPVRANAEIWSKALGTSLDRLKRYTPAQPGDRTLMDALHPFVETLGKTGNVKDAAAAARKGAESTKGMKASLGRTVYVGGSGYKEVPDPGAYGLSVFLEGLAEGL